MSCLSLGLLPARLPAMQESWDEIVRSAMVVRGLQATTADVVPPERMPPFFIPPENMSREEVLLLLTRIAERLSWATTVFKNGGKIWMDMNRISKSQL